MLLNQNLWDHSSLSRKTCMTLALIPTLNVHQSFDHESSKYSHFHQTTFNCLSNLKCSALEKLQVTHNKIMYKTWLRVKTLNTRLTVMYCTVQYYARLPKDKALVSSRVTHLVGRTCSGGATSQVSTSCPSRFSSSTCTYSLNEQSVAEQIFGSDPQDYSLHALVSTELRVKASRI